MPRQKRRGTINLSAIWLLQQHLTEILLAAFEHNAVPQLCLGKGLGNIGDLAVVASNAGAENIVAPKSLGFTSETSEEKEHEDMKSKVMEEVKRIFRPEFINRIDDIIVFHMLKKEQIGQIVDIMMRTVNNRIMEQMSLSVELDDEAKAYIVDKGYDSKYGARPLRRTIQNEIEDVMAEKILEGSIKAGNKVLVTVKDGKLNFSCKRGHNRNIHK